MRKILKNNFDKIVLQNLGKKCIFQVVSYQVIANTQKNVTKIKKKVKKSAIHL